MAACGRVETPGLTAERDSQRDQDLGWNVNSQALNIRGATQLEIFQGTVDAMIRELTTDPARFWQETLAKDGPIEIWEINGERFLFNGNHRYQAAVQAGVDIPDFMIRITERTGSTILTFPLDKLVWLPGLK